MRSAQSRKSISNSNRGRETRHHGETLTHDKRKKKAFSRLPQGEDGLPEREKSTVAKTGEAERGAKILRAQRGNETKQRDQRGK